MVFILSILLSGCCRNDIPPILDSPQITQSLADESLIIPLDVIVIDSSLSLDDLEFNVVSSNPEIETSISDGWLRISPTTTPYNGTSDISISVTDKCEQVSTEIFTVTFGAGDISDSSCLKNFSYSSEENTTNVFLAGEFNDWNTTSHPLRSIGDNEWELDVLLDEPSAYKFVVEHNGDQHWTCDPSSDWFQCDEGQAFENSCELGISSCNSIASTSGCNVPTINVDSIETSSSVAQISLVSSDLFSSIEVTYNDSVEVQSWNQDITVVLDSTNRHTVRLTGITASGQRSESLYFPFWTDDFNWNQATMYFAFVDRFANGDTSNDSTYGTNWQTGDYLGGDWQGIIDNLDHIVDLGANAIWINSPLNNPSGTYDGSCGMTITGYHGYWPSNNWALEEHFGDEEVFNNLIQEAHARGIRILVDWVGNHVHEEHAWYTDHPDWFTSQHLCEDGDNWNQATETCWFAPYVPTLDYSQTGPIVENIEDAIEFAIQYDIDGFRVDAVKHMPMAIHWNLERQIQNKIEHTDLGQTMEFYTVGETFSGDRGLLASYVDETLLDGQFDFAVYWSLLDVIGRNQGSMIDLENTYFESADFFEGHTMSNFLGNHDVERFLSHAAGEVNSLYGDGLCTSGDWRVDAQLPTWSEPYQRLGLAWAWILTHPGVSLIYYGDEVGLPGYHDPDNRQMMSWDWNSDQEQLHQMVQMLGQARSQYPQLSSFDRQIWWESVDTLGYAVHENNQHALILLNRSSESKTFANAVTWVNLPTSAEVEEVLSGQTVLVEGDWFEQTVAPRSAQIWIWQ